MRTSKTYDGTTTYYNYQGDKLLSQYNQNDDGSIDEVIFFLYDGDDNIIGMNYDGNFYYYQKNVLGDVAAVYDSNGVCVAEYEYDAWGNCIKQTGGQNENLGIDYINPIRYRSYYYENSVGMYYLQSRYYYATAGRFINADDPQIALDSKEDTDGTNLFAYCCNDPVNNVDDDGRSKKSKWLKIPRKFVASFIDVILALIPGIGGAFAPIKTLAKKYGKATLKVKARTPLAKLIRVVVDKVPKIAKGLQKIVRKIPKFGNKIADKIVVKKLQQQIASGISSAVINKAVNLLVKNIDLILSVGGAVSGILDYFVGKPRFLDGYLRIKI